MHLQILLLCIQRLQGGMAIFSEVFFISSQNQYVDSHNQSFRL